MVTFLKRRKSFLCAISIIKNVSIKDKNLGNKIEETFGWRRFTNGQTKRNHNEQT